MREILFRGKRTDTGAWVYGYLTKHPSAIQIGEHFGPYYIQRPPEDPDDSGDLYNVIAESVGQYTGVDDKNGKKIFEGDIIKTHYANAVKGDFIEKVIFYNGRFVSMYQKDGTTWRALLADGIPNITKTPYMESCEIIGNIHDGTQRGTENEKIF